MLSRPCSQVPAVRQQLCEPRPVIAEAGTAVDGDSTGYAVLGAAQPLPPELPHASIVRLGKDSVLEKVHAVVVAYCCRAIVMQSVDDADGVGFLG